MLLAVRLINLEFKCLNKNNYLNNQQLRLKYHTRKFLSKNKITWLPKVEFGQDSMLELGPIEIRKIDA